MVGIGEGIVKLCILLHLWGLAFDLRRRVQSGLGPSRDYHSYHVCSGPCPLRENEEPTEIMVCELEVSW